MLIFKPLKTLTAIVLLLFLFGCTPTQSPTVQKPTQVTPRSISPAQPSASVHLLLGNPSNATEEIANSDNYLILRSALRSSASLSQYALSYNRSKGIPNWTSWQLNAGWLGNLPRPSFAPDTSLPDGWYRVTPNDYSGSGFDRGHMVPAADRNKTPDDSASVFLMTNIIPQAPDNNQGPWEKLESYSRELAREGKELYIIAGSSGVGGTGKEGTKTTIANGKVTVPARTWKIVVVLDKPGLGLNGVTKNTRVIAIDLPNSQGIKDDNWTKYVTSVDAIEKLTGYDFLSNVSPNIQASIESIVDKVDEKSTKPISNSSTLATATQATNKQAKNCSPAYPDVCIPPSPPDLDCKDIEYKNFKVLPPDPHKFDSKDKDGVGCEGN